jgi:hypothetical protein
MIACGLICRSVNGEPYALVAVKEAALDVATVGHRGSPRDRLWCVNCTLAWESVLTLRVEDPDRLTARAAGRMHIWWGRRGARLTQARGGTTPRFTRRTGEPNEFGRKLRLAALRLAAPENATYG